MKRLTRAFTKRNTACGERLARFIPYIHCTSGYRQYGNVGNTASKSKLSLFQDRDFACDLADSKSTSGGVLCALRSHTSVPTSWTCKKKTNSCLTQQCRSRNNLIRHWLKIGRHFCTQLVGHGNRCVTPARRDPVRDNKPKKTTPLKTDRRIADSIASVPLDAHISFRL